MHHLCSRVDLTERDIRRAFNALSGETPRALPRRGTAAPAYIGWSARRAKRDDALGSGSTESLSFRLVQAVALAAEGKPDAEKRGNLKTPAALFGSAGRDVMVDVTSGVISRQIDGK